MVKNMEYGFKQSVCFDEDTLKRLKIMERHYGLNRSSMIRMVVNVYYHSKKDQWETNDIKHNKEVGHETH